MRSIMPRKKSLRNVNEIWDDAIVGVCPEGCELKAVTGLFLPGILVLFGIIDVVVAGTVGIVLCVHAVGDHEDLHELIQTTPCPKGVPLITVDLIEGFTDSNATAF